jgi:intracellular sulfur oxidation DsrE/DsrF family protein
MGEKPKKEPTTILITSEGMGNTGDVQLQLKLLKNYLHLMNVFDMLPAAICFYTDGVKLAVEGSPVMDELKSLEDKGVWLIVCQTCLKTFNLVEKVKVGFIGGMTDIIEAQWRADKVITL